MKDKIDGFQYYRNYHEIIKYLPDKERLKIYDAIMGYMFDDIIPADLKGIVMGIFMNLKMPLDTSKNGILNGKKGGRPKKSENKTQSITQIESENKPKGKPKTKPNNNLSTFLLSTNSKFIKPTIEDIKKYCLERNNKVDADRFYDFYESKGWKVGNQPMKDWKACVRTWERRNNVTNTRQEPVPSWFNQKVEERELTEQEKKELDGLLEEFK